jgi:hypothetical protein
MPHQHFTKKGPHFFNTKTGQGYLFPPLLEDAKDQEIREKLLEKLGPEKSRQITDYIGRQAKYNIGHTFSDLLEEMLHGPAGVTPETNPVHYREGMASNALWMVADRLREEGFREHSMVSVAEHDLKHIAGEVYCAKMPDRTDSIAFERFRTTARIYKTLSTSLRHWVTSLTSALEHLFEDPDSIRNVDFRPDKRSRDGEDTGHIFLRMLATRNTEHLESESDRRLRRILNKVPYPSLDHNTVEQIRGILQEAK